MWSGVRKRQLGISCVTFHNVGIPVWCNDPVSKLIHFQIPTCVTLSAHTTVPACSETRLEKTHIILISYKEATRNFQLFSCLSFLNDHEISWL